jgi:hypothetical protein
VCFSHGGQWNVLEFQLQTHYIRPILNVQPYALAVNHVHSATIYMGDGGSGGVCVSSTRGDSWTSPASGPVGVFKLIVDPRTASTLATTVILAAAANGVWRSANGGTSWSNVLAGQITSLVADMPTTGTDHYYAGVANAGVFTTTNLVSAWTNLNNAGIGLPKFTGANFQFVLVDYCLGNLNRVYAWFANPSKTVGLYTTSSPTTSWTQIAAISPPELWILFLSPRGGSQFARRRGKRPIVLWQD